MNLVQRLKDTLVRWGPGNPLTRAALSAAMRKQGYRVDFKPGSIALTRGSRTILMRPEDLSFVPVMAEMHRHFFDMLEADRSGREETLDFSQPRVHKYLRTGLEVIAPGIAEDDSMREYTLRFSPLPGMKVFDLGAHAGLTTIELSRMVTDSGHVYAFEPDRGARGFLHRNLERYGIANVTVLDVAIGEHSGRALFSMNATHAAGLLESVVYPSREKLEYVRVATLARACEEIGTVPDFIKADIEGGELGMIRGALDFLKTHRVHMALETHRLRDGSFTQDHLQPLLVACGYEVERSAAHQNFLYATPAGARTSPIDGLSGAAAKV